MKKILLLLLFSLIMADVQCNAEDFLMLATPQAPFKFKENGAIKGIDVEIVARVMKKLGIPYTIKLIESDSRIHEEARQGRADMLILFSKKESRMEYLIYPEESYINLTWNFFIRKEDVGNIRFKTFDDFRGLKIGATQAVSYTPDFWNAGLDLDLVVLNHLQIRKLLAKRIDAVPLNTITTLYNAQKMGSFEKLSYLPKPMKTKPYYNVFPKASDFPDQADLIRQYDKAIREMKDDGTIQTIITKYLGASLVSQD